MLYHKQQGRDDADTREQVLADERSQQLAVRAVATPGSHLNVHSYTHNRPMQVGYQRETGRSSSTDSELHKLTPQNI
jgi:hypothetical protein